MNTNLPLQARLPMIWTMSPDSDQRDCAKVRKSVVVKCWLNLFLNNCAQHWSLTIDDLGSSQITSHQLLHDGDFEDLAV